MAREDQVYVIYPIIVIPDFIVGNRLQFVNRNFHGTFARLLGCDRREGGRQAPNHCGREQAHDRLAERSGVGGNPMLAGVLEKYSGCSFDPISHGIEECLGLFDIRKMAAVFEDD